jgi:hypothetical protein
VEETWTFGNGIDRWEFGPEFQGNGNGFKLGGGEPAPAVAHQVRNSLAWGNSRCGFDHNDNLGALWLTHNTAFDNGHAGFCFYDGIAQLRNNLSIGGKSPRIGDSVDDIHNSWTLPVSATAEDFVSTDPAPSTDPRAADGALPQSDFLRLRADSDLADVGAKLGDPYTGAAPDLGAFEQPQE